jgi:hypothetical protein
MPLENPYCVVSDVARETGNSDPALFEVYEMCINSASRFIDIYTNRDFLPHNFTSEPFIPKESQIAGRHLLLPWKIRSIESIKVETLELDDQLYEYDGRAIILKAPNQLHSNQLRNYATYIVRADSKWPKTKNAIEVYGEFGYTPPDSWDGESALEAPCSDIPASIKIACSKIAASWSLERRRERGTMDGERVSVLDDRIPEDAYKLIKRFAPLFV